MSELTIKILKKALEELLLIQEQLKPEYHEKQLTKLSGFLHMSAELVLTGKEIDEFNLIYNIGSIVNDCINSARLREKTISALIDYLQSILNED